MLQGSPLGGLFFHLVLINAIDNFSKTITRLLQTTCNVSCGNCHHAKRVIMSVFCGLDRDQVINRPGIPRFAFAGQKP